MKTLQVSEDELRALLVSELEVIGEAEFEGIRAIAKRLRTTVGWILVERGHIPPKFLLEQLARSWGVEFIDLKISDVKLEALRALNEEFARKNALVPFDLREGQLLVAMCDPRDRAAVAQAQRKAGHPIVPVLAPGLAIHRAHLLYKGDLREMLKKTAHDGAATVTQPRQAGEGPAPSATELLSRVLEYAALTQASDIHIEPYQTESLVRYRIDGVLQEVLSLAPEIMPALISHIKVLSGMRIDQRRMPQDGRFDTEVSGLPFDLRVSSLPTYWGEKIALRLLPKELLSFDLDDLGLADDDYQAVFRHILRPHGMILVTGPTGCGKSTTLYAMLSRLGAERKYVVNISTVEDPVEYSLPRVNQISINPSGGLLFPTALRALLRQDPDVIMVGEIRDRETAEIAVRSALVGRLLFSTLHTNDATGAIPRLLDMGVEPFLLASTLSLVIGQRLVRRICTGCRESFSPDASVLAALKARPDFARFAQAQHSACALGKGEDSLAGIRLFRAKGCPQCQGSGFRGRVGLFEIFEVTEEIRGMAMQHKDAATIRAAAIAGGMKTLYQDGLAKVFLGQTSLEEVARVAS